MPWNLEINIIDVGQGESTLIIADNGAGQQRSLLIDAGLSGVAQTVHTYVAARLAALGLAGLDHILVSHYDLDHSAGVIALLVADNLYKVCDVIAQLAAAATTLVHGSATRNGRPNQIAASVAAAYAAALGAYNDPGGADYTLYSTHAVAATRNDLGPMTDVQAADFGIQQAKLIMDYADPVNPSLIKTANKLNATARRVGITAANAIANGFNVAASARTDVFNSLKTVVKEQGARFQTGGIYANTHVIDIGDTAHVPEGYLNTINGSYQASSFWTQAPGIARNRTGLPDLGEEVLWNTGPNAIAAPANSPAMFVVARRKYIWQAPARDLPIASGQPENDDSLAVILRFNQFFYYSGGDLPWQGENLIATAIRNNGLPNPTGGNFPAPPSIACFKCGHHGSDHSTSQMFLTTLQPHGAFISAGDATFGDEHHPTQGVVDRLHNQGSVQFFYLTNCRYTRNYVPASENPAQNQLPVAGNKSRLAGDNADNNLQPGRNRGDIRLTISQAESQAAAGPGRQYHVRYFDADGTVNNFRVENTQF